VRVGRWVRRGLKPMWSIPRSPGQNRSTTSHQPPWHGVRGRRHQADGGLDRQVARLRAHDAAGVVFTDVACGRSERRAGLRKALGECMKPGVDRLVVQHPDRVARFGVGGDRAAVGWLRGAGHLHRRV
jgi:hypothetical protein